MTTTRKPKVTPRKPTVKTVKFLPEDLYLETMVVHNGTIQFLQSYVRANYIYRITESVEQRNMSCVWISGDNSEIPLIANAPVIELYRAWIEGRKNIYINQRNLSV
jgi:hypothetical protein